MKKLIIIRLSGVLILTILTFILSIIPDNKTRLIAGIVIGLPALIMLLIALSNLGRKAFAVKAVAKILVTNGLYSKIRHPLYIFLDIFLCGIIIILGMSWLLLIWVALVATHIIAAEHEEKVLASAFGIKYIEYREKTWL